MLTFDEASHTYRWKGTPVPSVTQVLSPYTDLSKIPRAILDHKRALGQAVHRAIELYLADDLDESSLDPQVADYFAGFLAFEAHSGFRMQLSEQRVYSPKHGFAGTLDLLGELPTGPALIDTKCTTTIYPTAGPQTAAYAEAVGERRIARYILQLSPGKYELVPCRDRSDWNIFLAALTLHHWRSKC